MVADDFLAQRLHAQNVEFFAALAPAVRAAGIGPGEPFLDLDGSIAFFAGDSSPLTQASGSLTDEHLARITEFYRGRVTSWEAIVTPFRRPDALQRVKDLGGIEMGWESSFVRSLADPLPVVDLASEITMIEVGPAELGAWSEITTRGFFGDEPSEMALSLARLFDHTDVSRRYMAYWDGAPAATATLTPGANIVFLGGMTTVPEFRGRGLQMALLRKLLEDSRGIADLATIGAAPGTSSHRNIERVGFEVAFTLLSLRVPAPA